MGLCLRHAVKIKPDIDVRLAPRHTLPQAAIELRQRGRLFGNRAFFADALLRHALCGLIRCDVNFKVGRAPQRFHPAGNSPPQRPLVVA
jgi:hypothetical protein